MEYQLYNLVEQQDKKFKIKNHGEKTYIYGLSKKTFEGQRDDASRLAQQTKDYSLEYHVVGSTFLKLADDNDEDFFVFNDEKYKICEGKFSFTRGYLSVGNNEYLRVATRLPFIIWFFLLGILLIGLCLGLHSCTPDIPINPTETTPSISIDGSNTGDIVPNQSSHTSLEEEFIEIKVFPEIVVDETTPNIPLYNSENNTVYFLFNVYEGNSLLHKTGLIPPGYRVQWDAKHTLENGEHDLRVVIECFDLTTKSPCDGATTHCKVIVE